MSRKVMAILLTLLITAVLGGCGVKEKVNEKISEKVTESVINSAMEGETTVDIDGDKVTVKGENGEEFNFGDGEWPDSGAAQLIPHLKKGRVVSAMNSNQACSIIVEELDGQDFERYFQAVQEEGFTQEVNEFTSDTVRSYSAGKENGAAIILTYDSEQKVLTINFESGE